MRSDSSRLRYPFRRTFFAGRHLLYCGVLTAGELAGFAIGELSAAWPFAAFVTIVVALAGCGWRFRGWTYAVVALVGICLSLRVEHVRRQVLDYTLCGSGPFTAELPVLGGIAGSADWLSFDSETGGVEVRVICRRSEGGARALSTRMPLVGEVWRCSGWLERKDWFDRAKRRLWVSGRGAGAEFVCEPSPHSLSGLLIRVRRRLSKSVGIGLSHSPDAAELERAILLGERARLSAEARRMFTEAGTIHVFAISGMHIGVVAMAIVYLLMGLFFFPLRWVALPLAPILAAYVVMIGAPPSAVRAAFMAVLYFTAPIFRRRSDSLASWSITYLVFHIVDPGLLFNVGSLLSFAVMLGILLYIRWAAAFDSWLLTACGVSAAAWAAGAGIAARVFCRFTPGGLIANLAVVPLASGVVVLGLLGALFGLFSPWLGAHFNNAAALMTQSMATVSWAVWRLPVSGGEVESWSYWQCFAWYAAIVLVLWLVRSVYLHRKERI